MSRRKRKERQFKTRFKENRHLKIISGGQVETITRQKKVNIVPRNFKQDDLLGLLSDTTKPIVFATGPAGTGKTIVSTLYAIQQFKKGTLLDKYFFFILKYYFFSASIGSTIEYDHNGRIVNIERSARTVGTSVMLRKLPIQ